MPTGRLSLLHGPPEYLLCNSQIPAASGMSLVAGPTSFVMPGLSRHPVGYCVARRATLRLLDSRLRGRRRGAV